MTSVESEAEENGFGTGTRIVPFILLVVYAFVGVFAVGMDEMLNGLEYYAKDTTYQSMMQRIYREVMVMGLSSFVLGIMESGNISLGEDWDLAYYFADQCSFITALFFAFHGFGIMAISIRDARAWERAGKIKCDDLVRDVEEFRAFHPLLWRYRVLPLSSTRNQVEFRMFRALFSSTYHIGADTRTFDFSHFLRKTHENNLLELINLNPWKWCLMIVMIGFASLEGSVYTPSCSTPDCERRIQLSLFIAGGCLVFLCSVVLVYIGRKSEYLLLRKMGVFGVADYDIFLMKERRVIELISSRILDRHTIVSTIAELKHESAVKSFHKQEGLLLSATETGRTSSSHGPLDTSGTSKKRIKKKIKLTKKHISPAIGRARGIRSNSKAADRTSSPKDDATCGASCGDSSAPGSVTDVACVSPVGSLQLAPTYSLQSNGSLSSPRCDSVESVTPNASFIELGDSTVYPERELSSETKDSELKIEVDSIENISAEDCIEQLAGDTIEDLPEIGTISKLNSAVTSMGSIEYTSVDDDAVETDSDAGSTKSRPQRFSLSKVASSRMMRSLRGLTSECKSDSKDSYEEPKQNLWKQISRKGSSFKNRPKDAISSLDHSASRGKLPLPPKQQQARTNSAKNIFDSFTPDGRKITKSGLALMSEFSPSVLLSKDSTPAPVLRVERGSSEELLEVNKATANNTSDNVKPPITANKPRELTRDQQLAREALKDKLRIGFNDGADHITNFRDIFLWKRPELFYGLIDVVMTANSLYLSWWVTTFSFVAYRLGHTGESFMWMFVALLPPLCTFPLLAIVIRTATILRSLTELDLDVVASVMEKTQEIRKNVNLLRGNLRTRIERLDADSRDQAVADLFRNVDDTENGELTREDFRRMLVRLQVDQLSIDGLVRYNCYDRCFWIKPHGIVYFLRLI